MPDHPTAPGAVFLSYASQDVEAAKRICDALRQAGVEVWFDQSELVGGDAWDAKIRGQIASCALFVPIISANTQARLEGYFRLEWKLAAQRTHTMADEKTFLLPILLDGTRDAEARVPAEFKSVQWTKLPGGETPPAFCARVKKLLDGSEIEAGRSRPAEERGRDTLPATKTGPAKWWWALPMFGVAMALALVMREGRKNAPPVTPAAPPAVAGPRTEAQKLTAQARALALHDQLDEVTREDFALAEQLLKRAVESDPLDGEAMAAYAQCACGQISLQYDSSQAKRAEARSRAERALKLAPDSDEARFAWAWSYRFQQAANRDEMVRLHREVAARLPTDKRVLRQTGRAIDSISGTISNNDSLQDHAEARTYYARAAALPGGDAIALRLLADSLLEDGHVTEAEQAMERAIALRPSAGHLYTSRINQLISRGADLAAAQAVLAKMPPAYLLDDQGAYVACWVWLWSRRPEECLAVLRGLSHDYIDARYFVGPKTALTGRAHEMAGRHEAALAEWRIALEKTEQRLAADPGATIWLAWKAELLARLGEKATAEKALQVYDQLRAPQSQGAGIAQSARILLGQHDRVLASLEQDLNRHATVTIEQGISGRVAPSFFAHLRWDPVYDPLRGDPRFQKLLEQAEAALAEPRTEDGGRKTAQSVDRTPAPSDKSVAVLAFANLSDDKGNEYFSDGISEELLNVLAKVPGLKVSARTSAFYFKGKEVPIPEIAKQLGVAYVVEGSVRRQGEKVRIRAQLIKAADGFNVWNETFTRDLKDIFAVQDEIAGLIAKQLSLKIGVSSAAATAAVNPEAFELYVQARRAWNLRNAAGFTQAEELLTRALMLEPDFARAHVALADVWMLRAIANGVIDAFGQRDAPIFAQITSEIQKALALDPDSSEARASWGLIVRLQQWDLAKAERELRRAVELNPNYATAHHWLGNCLFESGWVDEGLVELRRAAELDPFSLRILESYAQGLVYAGRGEEALAVLGRAEALQARSPLTLFLKAEALLRLGRRAEAVAAARELDVTVRPDLLARAGEKAEAEAALGEAEGWGRYLLLAALGRTREALATLRAEDFPGTEVGNWLLDPRLDPFRSDPHFVELLTTLGLTEAHARMQAWRQAHSPEGKK